MDLESPESWRILWLCATGLFVVAETLRRLRLWFLPLAIGCAVAGVAAFAYVPVALEIALFAAVSAAALAALRPVACLLGAGFPLHPVGSNRWVGRQATVAVDIPPRHRGAGRVLLGRERWRAVTNLDASIPAGSAVVVIAVDGTHVTVVPEGFANEKESE